MGVDREAPPVAGAAARRRGDEAGSMPVALLLTVATVSLATLVVPVSVGQSRSTAGSLNRMRALQAAVTGLEVGVAGIRAAYDAGTGAGARAALPCGVVTTAGTSGAEASATYHLRVDYYAAPPAGTAAAVPCATVRGSGPLPPYALVQATGRTTGATEVRRALRGVYPLRAASPAPAPAGTGPTYGPEHDLSTQPRMIYAWSPTENSTDVCIDAGASVPAPGTQPLMRLCDGLNHPTAGYKQFWYYRENLTIATVGSLLANRGRCLDGGAAPSPGERPTIQECASPPPPRQRWFYNNAGNLELAAAAGPGPDDLVGSGLCLNVQNAATSGSRIILGTGGNCRSSSPNTRQTFSYATKLGPGLAAGREEDCTAAAGYPCVRRQVVNYINPGRCLDWYDNMAANMECVHEPRLDQVRWTQVWRVPVPADGPAGVTGPLVSVDGSGRTWCLTASADFPTRLVCNPRSPRADQRFRFYANTGNPYTMYRIVDSSGRCMTHPNDHKNGVDANFFWNYANWNWRIRMDSCATSRGTYSSWNSASVVDRQKWNAPAALPASGPTAAPTVAPPTPAPTGSPWPATVEPLTDITEVPA